MTDLTHQTIENKLSEYKDPYLQQDLLSAKVIKAIDVTPTKITITLTFGYPFAGSVTVLTDALNQLLHPITHNREISWKINWQIESHVGQRGLKGLPQIKNMIAVASGKGGVGKSTTAVNLAIALSQQGACVGILDADIYGPSQPCMLGLEGQRPDVIDQKKMKPLIRYGIQSMSMGYLIDKNTAMIWRGPMVTTALQQLLNETEWDNLDYLVIDLPPGTGDIQLTLAQKIPVSGAVIVTTPQELALLDARRAIEMFNKVNVPVLGIIENMSTHVCSHCGHEESIFGSQGGEQLARQYQLDLLGRLPLDREIREQTDQGSPPVIDPAGKYAKLYGEIARRIAAKLALQTKDYSSKFPNIVIK